MNTVAGPCAVDVDHSRHEIAVTSPHALSQIGLSLSLGETALPSFLGSLHKIWQCLLTSRTFHARTRVTSRSGTSAQ